MADPELSAQEARQQLYERVRKDVPFEQKAEDLLKIGVQYLDVENGHLTRIDPVTDHWEAIVSTSPPNGRFPPGLELDLETTYCRRTLKTDSGIALHDVPDQGWADDPAFETHGLHCYHGTTLLLDEEPYGTVCFVAREPRDDPFCDVEHMFTELTARLLERELEREQYEAELTRQTNLATVLNRVLRHNLRNDLSVIRGYTQLMVDSQEDTQYGDIVLRNVDSLIDLSQKARELDEVVTAEFERQPTEIETLVKGIVEQIEQEYPSASISVEYEDTITATVFPSFERAIEELVENAAKHSGEAPTITVSIEIVPNAVEIRIIDDGPGLDSQEGDVLKKGKETPLMHGSGLGHWLVHWIVTSHNGSIETTTTDRGTTITLSVPRTPETNAQEQLTELQQARDKYRAAFEGASDAMILVNDDARILDANREANSLYDVPKPELLGQSLQEFLPDTFDFDTAWCEFLSTGSKRDIVTIVSDDDVKRTVEYSATANIVPDQHLIIIRGVRNDATE